MAIKLADTARPNNYVDAEHLGTYPVAYAEDVWFEDGTRLSEKTFEGQSIQKDELPLATATELGNIYQYTGTDGTYKHGYFYECIETSGSYNWNPIDFGAAIENVEVLPTTNIDNKFYRDVSEQTIDLVFHKSDTSLEYFQNQLKKIGFITDGVLIDNGDWKYYQYTPTYEVRYNFIAGMQRVLHAQLYTVLSGTEQVVLIIYGLDDHVNASVFAGRKTTVLTIYYDDNKLYAGNATEQVLDRVALMSDIVDEDAVIYVNTIPNVDDYEVGTVICYSGEDSGMFNKGHHYQKVDNVAVEKKCGMATDFKYQTYDTVYFDVDGTVLTDVQNPYNQTEATVAGESSSSWTDCVGFNSDDYAQSNKIRVITRDQEENTLYYCKLILDLDTNVITAGERIDISVNDYAQRVYTVNYIGVGTGWADIGGGGNEEFVGTQAEWNALTAQEKEKYDGKIVNIVEDGKTSTQEVEELTNYLFTEQALAAFPDITQRFHAYKYGQLIQISCDNIAIGDRSLLGDYFKVAEGLPAPVFTINFTYPTYPDESVGKSGIAAGYVGTGGNITLRHTGMISDSATYLQGFTVVYLTREA